MNSIVILIFAVIASVLIPSIAGVNFGNAFTLFELLKPADFKCLIGHGQVPIVRIYAGGKIDPNGMPNIENAKSVGFQGIEVYVQPELLNSGLKASQQFEQSYKYVNDKFPMQRIWLLVTDARTWSRNSIENVNFIKEFIKAANGMNVAVGIYTNWYDWLLVTNDYKGLQADCAPAKGCQLWYWHTLGQGATAKTEMNFNDFRQFGSWKVPNVKEYDIVDNQICGVTLNWSIFANNKGQQRQQRWKGRTGANEGDGNNTTRKRAGPPQQQRDTQQFIIGDAF